MTKRTANSPVRIARFFIHRALQIARHEYALINTMDRRIADLTAAGRPPQKVSETARVATWAGVNL